MTRSLPRPPSLAATLAFATACAVACAGFCALGVWQLQRRVWKLDLIARVEARVQAPAVTAPGPSQWPSIDAAHDEYRRVVVRGRFLPAQGTLVQANTELGPGYWVLAPLRDSEGHVFLVNRGFVASAAEGQAGAPEGETSVTGLLRLSEPGGSWLRRNDPVAGRWYSRDVAEIAATRGWTQVAPFFIDAQADRAAPSLAGEAHGPIAGLTVVKFRNSHLAYALTWFALAGLAAAAAAGLLRGRSKLAPSP